MALLDANGKPFAADAGGYMGSPDFRLMDDLLKAATKKLPFFDSPAAKVRKVAKECSRDWPEEPTQRITFRLSYGPADG